MMVPWRLSLLLLAALTLHACLSAQSEVSDGRSRRDIIALYNQREGVTYLYKALEEAETPDTRSFFIKETECLNSDSQDGSRCDFKSDGDVKICALGVGNENRQDIKCTSVSKNVLVKRNGRKKCIKPSKTCQPPTGGGSTIGFLPIERKDY
ncbi:uncharacterized protein RB166_021602 isoform 2-T2 [Leptodactylus fuscus]